MVAVVRTRRFNSSNYSASSQIHKIEKRRTMMRLRLWVLTLLLITMVMLPSTFTSSKAALSIVPVPANAPNVNLALQKFATQSSVDSGNTADRAVDGNNGTFAQTNSEVHAWWQVDL